MIWNISIKKHIAAHFAVAALMLGGASAQPYRLVVVQGTSMSPTYTSRSLHLETPFDGNPRKGEVVVLDSPVGTVIKRIAYLPGEAIRQVKVGDVWTDMVSVVMPHQRLRRFQTRIFRVPLDKVYVLGDNRAESVDSTVFGPVATKNITGTLSDQRPRSIDPDWLAHVAAERKAESPFINVKPGT